MPEVSSMSSSIVFLRRPQLESITGRKRSAIYADMAAGILPRPVNLGPRAVGWPKHEIEAISAARLAGKSEPEIRALVAKLHAARTAG
jgi:prophage regulatory protein